MLPYICACESYLNSITFCVDHEMLLVLNGIGVFDRYMDFMTNASGSMETQMLGGTALMFLTTLHSQP